MDGREIVNVTQGLIELGTACISDALDRLGVEGACLGLVPMARTFRLAGPAFTVRMLPRGMTDKSVGDYIDDVPPGHVVVIDNQGRLDATVWGDILTSVAAGNGAGGTVIDGVCRDSDRSIELDYPLYALAATMRTGKDRVCAEAYNEPVQIRGIRVEPGDWLIGDADGIVAVPAALVGEVLRIGGSIARAEGDIRASLAAGERLDRARAAGGYHSLQTRARSPEEGS